MLWIAGALRRRALIPVTAALIAVGVSDLIGARLLKPACHRMRPFDALPGGTVHQAFQVSHLGSMPSLHAANAFALAVVLSRAVPRLAPVLYGFATLIALSRVVGGVHWPSDVAAGALIGSAIGFGASWCAEPRADLAGPIEAQGAYSRVLMTLLERRERPAP